MVELPSPGLFLTKKKLFYLYFRIIGSRSKLQGGSTIKTGRSSCVVSPCMKQNWNEFSIVLAYRYISFSLFPIVNLNTVFENDKEMSHFTSRLENVLFGPISIFVFLKVQKSNHLTFFKGETKLPSQFETNSFRKVEFFSSSCTVVWLYGLSKGEGVKRKNMRFLSIRRGETKLSYWKYPINLIWIHYLKSGLCYSLQVVE